MSRSVKVYGTYTSCGTRRVLTALEEKGISYQLVHAHFDKKDGRMAELMKMHVSLFAPGLA